MLRLAGLAGLAAAGLGGLLGGTCRSGWPLFDSELAGGCVTCPWHGSTFRVTDGAVVHGPASAPQPVFQTWVRGSIVQVCLPDTG